MNGWLRTSPTAASRSWASITVYPAVGSEAGAALSPSLVTVRPRPIGGAWIDHGVACALHPGHEGRHDPLARLFRSGHPLAALTVDGQAPVRVEGDVIASTAWLSPLLTMIQSEAADGQAGSSAVLAKIADVCLTQALWAWLVGAERAGLLDIGQLQDAGIGKAVTAIRARPAEHWSLDKLARLAGLSRSAFAARFRTHMGEPPMRYVAKARLSLAAGYLTTGRRSLYEIALLSGYDNESTLSKAFRRELGMPPGRYREAARRPPPISVVS